MGRGAGAHSSEYNSETTSQLPSVELHRNSFPSCFASGGSLGPAVRATSTRVGYPSAVSTSAAFSTHGAVKTRLKRSPGVEGHDGLDGERGADVDPEPASEVDGGDGVPLRHPRAELPALRR